MYELAYSNAPDFKPTWHTDWELTGDDEFNTPYKALKVYDNRCGPTAEPANPPKATPAVKSVYSNVPTDSAPSSSSSASKSSSASALKFAFPTSTSANVKAAPAAASAGADKRSVSDAALAAAAAAQTAAALSGHGVAGGSNGKVDKPASTSSTAAAAAGSKAATSKSTAGESLSFAPDVYYVRG